MTVPRLSRRAGWQLVLTAEVEKVAHSDIALFKVRCNLLEVAGAGGEYGLRC